MEPSLGASGWALHSSEALWPPALVWPKLLPAPQDLKGVVETGQPAPPDAATRRVSSARVEDRANIAGLWRAQPQTGVPVVGATNVVAKIRPYRVLVF